jgi:hypothetical protein
MPFGAMRHGFTFQAADEAVTRTPKTLTNNGATFDSGASNKQFGSHSVSFDGVNDTITATANSDFLLTGDSPFTVEFWFKTSDTLAELINQQAAGTPDGWSIGIRSSERVLFTLGDGGGSSISVLVPSTGNFTNNTWTHAAVVCDGVGVAIFVDGSRVYHLATWGHDGSIGNLFQIGTGRGVSSGSYSDGPYYYNGNMDELRISTSERYDVSTSSYTEPTSAFTNDADTVLLMHFDNNVDDDGG